MSGGISIGFTGGLVTGGILSEYSNAWAVSGLTDSISGIDASNYLANNWTTGFNGPIDIVVPVPAAGILYASAIGLGLLQARRRRS